ncbi:MAG TPA: murein biosynthesis integral membrane protein MurJ [Bryobacteraceae bacterium]|nr:murein biosynthesis integral membrane protein MurJ [Bryobacteraceae bacterium]
MTLKRRGGATLVAAGILFSRLAGLVRESVFSSYFGLSPYADAFRVAFRIPNTLQNLFGEGVLSASFIPVYARLLAEGDEEEAGRVAGAVFSILALFTAVLVLVGVLATPYVIDFIATGLDDSRRQMAIPLVRIFFPGAGFLVMSAWCLGILNSHRRFFLSYSAPVLWSLIMIGAMLAAGGHVGLENLAIVVAWASVAGSAAQFLIQLPYVLKLAPRLHIALAHHLENVRIVIRNFVPVFFSRGVVQLSALIDMWLASYLPIGAIAALQNAQTLYLLPVSLFGMSISASELPEMSSTTTDAIRTRLSAGLRRISFFVIPSVVAFIALGDIVVGAIYQHGLFTAADTRYVWVVLAGSGVGLLASTQGRLFSSAFYALRDTKTPLKFAVIRVALTTVLGYICARMLPPVLGVDLRYGAAGLTASAGISGWIEFLLLRRALSKRIGEAPVGAALLARLWASAIVAAAIAWAIKVYLPIHNPKLAAVAILIPFGAIYILLTGPSQWKSIR